MFNDGFDAFERRGSRYGRRHPDVRVAPPGDRAAAAARMWERLRQGGLDGIAFVRARPVAGLLPAFVSDARMLVIEIMDRGWSEGALVGDGRWQRRRRLYREAGYRVVHVPADEAWSDTARRIRRLCALEGAEGRVVPIRGERAEDDGDGEGDGGGGGGG